MLAESVAIVTVLPVKASAFHVVVSGTCVLTVSEIATELSANLNAKKKLFIPQGYNCKFSLQMLKICCIIAFSNFLEVYINEF